MCLELRPHEEAVPLLEVRALQGVYVFRPKVPMDLSDELIFL